MYPADVVLFEGILMFYSQEIRDLFQMKLFVDTDADTRLSRRGETDKDPKGQREAYVSRLAVPKICTKRQQGKNQL